MSRESVKKKLAVNPEEADTVRLIYQWYVTGMGAKMIAERLNREGYGYRGKRWGKNRILDIVGDEAYIGKYYYNRRDSKTHKLKPQKEWILIPVNPIVDEGTWQRAKEFKDSRAPSDSSRNPAVVGSKTLLTGLAVCGLCGARMSLETAKGGKFTYYNCSNYLRRGKSTCVGQRIPGAPLEKAIIDHMANKLFTKERVKAILKGIYAELRKADKNRDGQRKSLIRQQDMLKGRLTKQYEAIESGSIQLDLVAERIKDLKSQMAAIEGRLAEIKYHPAIPLHLFKDESLERFQTTVKEMLLGDDRAMTKAYLKLFIDKIVINLPRIDISCKSDVLLAALENETAARSGDTLTAGIFWLPSADSNHGPDG
jgi:site-specific DNA recombinase